METLEWQEEVDGTFAAEAACFSLIVHRTDHRQARFLIMARRDAGPDQLVGSGTRNTIGEAKTTAEIVAHRLPNVVRRTRTLVIVVDDNDAVRGTIADVLRDSGYQVTEVASGEGALRRFERATRPCVLITDFDLGAGMSGQQLAASVHELWPATGVLLVSGDDKLLTGGSARDLILAKPFSIDQLLARVTMMAARLPLDDAVATIREHHPRESM